MRAHLVSAILGGLVAGGVLVVSGATGDRRTQTIIEEAPVAASTSANPASGLTPHDIYQRDAPGVVFVRARLIQQIQSPFNLVQGRPSAISTGSGFVVDRRGDILTTYDVVAGAERSGGVTVEFEGQVVRAASVVAVDQDDDLAVLHVDMRGVPPVLPLALGDSTSVRVGDPTLAIGNPFGLDRTLTSGIVSALQHQIQAAGGLSIDNVIQTDQPIGAGTSGGPLLDAGGRVIGINSQVTTAGAATGQQVAFAVPIDTANGILARVDRGSPVRLAYIGLGGGHAIAGRGSRAGVTVGTVAPGGPAALAGVRPGDRIDRVGGMAVASISDVLALVDTRSPGQILSLELHRGHQMRTLPVVLGSRTAPAPAP